MLLVSLIATNMLATAPATSRLAEPTVLESRPLDAFMEDHDSNMSSSHSSGLYLRLTGGLVTTESSSGPDEDIDFDEGYLLSVGIGQRIGASENGLGFSLELEGLWTDQDADDDGPIQAITDVTVAGALLNGIVDFRLADRLSLYGGAGIGVAWLDVGTKSDSINDFDDEDGPFLAWQAKAGLAWRFAPSTALHVGYRFLNIDDAEIDDGIGSSSFDLETQQHVIEAGLIFGF